MPLHLLPKKSWNPYNAENIARVRRDEAAAQAKEEEEDRRLQEIDAERRLAILRGEVPPPLPPPSPNHGQDQAASRRPAGSFERERKKRKRTGEDDTDFELRVAKERSEMAATARESLSSSRPSRDAPLVGRDGHIDLFGGDKSRAHAEKNEEAEKEKADKKREFEDQFTMRFANAAGRDGLQRPWYAKGGGAAVEGVASAEPPRSGKNVWGKDDPGRKGRDEARVDASDPLALMRKGASKVREVKKERRRLEEERERQLKQLRDEEKREERRRRRRNGDEKRRHRRRGSRSASPHRGRESSSHHRHREDDGPRRRSGGDERSY